MWFQPVNKTTKRHHQSFMPTCEVCTTEPSKYRCPKCNTEYCSLACFKTHKSSAPEAPGGCDPSSSSTFSTTSTNKNKFQNRKRRRDHTVEEPSHVSPDDLQKLSFSEPVLKAAKSSQLQEIVKNILAASDPHEALEARLKSDPFFSSFADEVMIAVGKAERTHSGQVLVHGD